ncbi:hypothetical protein E2C01_040267 [Portunus trituberculatus]|uniref:Uncharacterized protein n=1 Tax=Portunus trituberculatus TaxID=210409 RepID=A0A5B7FNR1_PORTR|nr:hypothetical protein [Portunus trituberculatus]
MDSWRCGSVAVVRRSTCRYDQHNTSAHSDPCISHGSTPISFLGRSGVDALPYHTDGNLSQALTGRRSASYSVAPLIPSLLIECIAKGI